MLAAGKATALGEGASKSSIADQSTADAEAAAEPASEDSDSLPGRAATINPREEGQEDDDWEPSPEAATRNIPPRGRKKVESVTRSRGRRQQPPVVESDSENSQDAEAEEELPADGRTDRRRVLRRRQNRKQQVIGMMMMGCRSYSLELLTIPPACL